MTNPIIVVREPTTTVTVAIDAVRVSVVTPGPPGPPGPPGADGLGTLSADPGNALTLGTDGGLYCSAVLPLTLHW